MAEKQAKASRQQRLSSFNLQYPMWLFSIDDPRWPRRLNSLLPESYLGRLDGWVSSASEYGMHLDRPQDLNPPQTWTAKPKARDFRATGKLANDALQQLRYDDRSCLDSLQAIIQRDDEQIACRLDSLSFDDDQPGWEDPSTFRKVERIWDHVPLWDPSIGLERISDFYVIAPLFGLAVLIKDDDDLIAASGISKRESGEVILKAEFERIDIAGEALKGIVCTPTYKQPGERGIILSQGPDYPHNKAVIAGTALENAGWDAVVEYRKGLRRSPLPLSIRYVESG